MAEIDPGTYHYALWGLSFIAAGVFYSASGYAKTLRRALTGDSVQLDYRKMGKSVVLGVILGITAMVLTGTVDHAAGTKIQEDILTNFGDLSNPFNTFLGFVTVAGSHTAIILAADKWLLGRPDPKQT